MIRQGFRWRIQPVVATLVGLRLARWGGEELGEFVGWGLHPKSEAPDQPISDWRRLTIEWITNLWPAFSATTLSRPTTARPQRQTPQCG
jgi:hypothetical protein